MSLTMRLRSHVAGPKRTSAVGLRRRGRAAGLTLAEFLLATTILLIIGLCIGTMIFSHFYDTYQQIEVRHTMVSQDLAARRLETAVRSSQMVLANGSGYLVLWLAGYPTSAQPCLTQLCRIELDPNTNTHFCYKAKTNPPPTNNLTWALTGTDFNAVTKALKTDSNFPSTGWAAGITSFTTTLDANAQQARRVCYSIGVLQTDVVQTAVGQASLRLR